MEAQERNWLHPALHAPQSQTARRGSEPLLPALRGSLGVATPAPSGPPAPGLPLAAVRPKPRVTTVFTSLRSRRFAEQAVFILFCVFAILLFSPGPEVHPWLGQPLHPWVRLWGPVGWSPVGEPKGWAPRS